MDSFTIDWGFLTAAFAWIASAASWLYHSWWVRGALILVGVVFVFYVFLLSFKYNGH